LLAVRSDRLPIVERVLQRGWLRLGLSAGLAAGAIGVFVAALALAH
jgi:hypothetical protein